MRQGSLLRTAWLLTGDEQAAQDLVQAALMHCWPRWHKIESAGADAYVRQAMVNQFRSWNRRRWTTEVPTEALPEPAAVTAWEPNEATETLRAALRSLPARQRATLVLRFFLDMSERQTADALHCSVGTVKSQTAKALSRLRADGRIAALSDEEIPS